MRCNRYPTPAGVYSTLLGSAGSKVRPRPTAGTWTGVVAGVVVTVGADLGRVRPVAVKYRFGPMAGYQ